MITVLHVDDDSFDLELVRFKLARVDERIRVESESNSLEALGRLRKENFDAVICDFQMPGIDGLTLLKQIREDRLGIPFVFLTGQGSERLAVEALQAGADDYFTKEEGLAHYERLAHSVRSKVTAWKETQEQRRIEQALKAVFSETDNMTGREFIDALLLKLADILGVEYVMLCEKHETEDDLMQTLSFVSGGEIVDNISYKLAGTPCENVFGRDVCVYENGVQEFFPDDKGLVKMNAVSYMGLPLFRRDGGPAGHVAILDTKPMTHTSFMTSLIRALSMRVGAELERMHMLSELTENERQMRNVLESMISGFALHEIICDESGDPIDYRFLNVNAAFGEQTGLDIEGIVGKRVLEVIPGLEHFWIEVYGRVALTGVATHFTSYSRDLGRFYEVRVYSPARGLFAVIFNDVTEQVNTEQRLRDSEQRFRTLVELNSTGIFRSTVDGRLRDCNQALLQMLGYSSFSEIKNVRLEEVYEDSSEREEIIADLKQQGVLKNRVVKLKRATGDRVECILNVQLVDNDHILGTLIEASEESLIQI